LADYQRETDELVPFTVTENGAPVAENVQWVAQPVTGTRPITEGEWQPAVVVTEATYFHLQGLQPGVYTLFARFTVGTEQPVLDCGQFRVL
jgi:hypothetical protein